MLDDLKYIRELARRIRKGTFAVRPNLIQQGYYEIQYSEPAVGSSFDPISFRAIAVLPALPHLYIAYSSLQIYAA